MVEENKKESQVLASDQIRVRGHYSGKCPVCGGVFAPSGIKDLLKCGTCGFVIADMDIAGADVGKLYGTDYFRGDGYADYASERPVLEINFKEYLKRIMREVGYDHTQKILFEVGCGFGYFLELSKGFFKKVEGCDISSYAVERATKDFGLAVREGDFMTLPIDPPVDVLCMWDVLPGMPEPDKVLVRVASLLPAAGILAITMPNIGSKFAKIAGKRWPLIHLPWRLHYFSPETITKLLEKSGFKVVYIESFNKTRSVREMLYQLLAHKFHRPDWFHTIEHMFFMDMKVSVGFRDEMFIMARKP